MNAATRAPKSWIGMVAAIIVAGLVAFALATALATRDQTLANETQNLQRIGLPLAEHTQRIFFSADLLLSSIEDRLIGANPASAEDFRRAAGTRAMHEAMHESVALTAEVDALTLVDAQGRIVNSSRSWPPPDLSVADRDYFGTLRERPPGAFVISAPLKNRITGQEVIFLARRISAADGGFLGMVSASFATSRFTRLFAAVLHDEGDSVAVYRRDGTLLVREPATGTDAQPPAEVREFLAQTLARSEQGKTHTHASGVGGTPELLALNAVRGYPLVVVAANAESAALSAWRQLAQLIFLVTLGAVLLVGVLGFTLLRQWKMQLQVIETEELRRLNQELQRAYGENRAVTETVHDNLYMLDVEGRLVWWNRRVEETTGKTADELRGAPGIGFFVAEDQAAVAQAVHEAFTTGQATVEARLVTLQGPIDYQFNGVRVLDAQGRLLGVAGAGRDVSENKRQREALSLSEGRLRQAVLVAGLGIFEHDHRSDTIYCSPEHRRIYELADDARVTVGTFFERMDPDDRDRMASAVERAHDPLGDGAFDVEYRIRRPNGEARWLATRSLTIFEGEGSARQPLRTVGAVLDITQRKHAEEALRHVAGELEVRVAQRTEQLLAAKDEAERANLAKSEFLSRMSHELRTPMNAVLGFTQLLELNREHPLAPLQRDYTRHIRRAGAHLLDLINEVLDLARVEAGKLEVGRETVSVRPVLAECLALVRPQANARGLRIEIDERQAGLAVVADRTRLKQVLLNLLSNAVKYNRDHGTIGVTCEGSHDTVRIGIADTGAGLSAAQQARLFVPFERLDADKGATEGTGIGLALSKRLVELMDGEIGVRSTVGVGSLFWLQLPAVDTDGLEADGGTTGFDLDLSMARPSNDAPFRILCIEDNPANLALIEQIVAIRPDVRLTSTADPHRGLELARELRPDLILLDIRLPGMDGYAVHQRLKAGHGTCAIPVVAISAQAMPEDLARGAAAGFAAYLTKPLDVRRFDRIVDELIAQKAQRRVAIA